MITFAIILQLFGRKASLAMTDWLLAFGVGAGLGLLLDAVIGTFGIFAYLPQGMTGPVVVPKELPLHVLLFNAFASYGVASRKSPHYRPVSYVSILFQDDGWLYVAPLPCVEWLVSCYFIQEASQCCSPGEPQSSHLANSSCASTRRLARFTLFALNYWRPLARLSFVVRVGWLVLRRLVNSAFPFWVWLPDSHFSEVGLKALIAVAGYLALFHPWLVLLCCFEVRNSS